jgi:hypothetical protein
MTDVPNTYYYPMDTRETSMWSAYDPDERLKFRRKLFGLVGRIANESGCTEYVIYDKEERQVAKSVTGYEVE